MADRMLSEVSSWRTVETMFLWTRSENGTSFSFVSCEMKTANEISAIYLERQFVFASCASKGRKVDLVFFQMYVAIGSSH
mmetsp:Transcript_36907/g.96558  ORF Transcript_36907/g.96558 Transcript_36907/m.96558 type:complete len:80 (-) Transcript_36907:432-671(-)